MEKRMKDYPTYRHAMRPFWILTKDGQNTKNVRLSAHCKTQLATRLQHVMKGGECFPTYGYIIKLTICDYDVEMTVKSS